MMHDNELPRGTFVWEKNKNKGMKLRINTIGLLGSVPSNKNRKIETKNYHQGLPGINTKHGRRIGT